MTQLLNKSSVIEIIVSAPLLMFLAAARAGVALTLVPFFGVNGMPRQIFILVTVGITVPFMLPTVLGKSFTPLLAEALILKEVFIGVLLGYFISLLFWGIEMAGELLDLQRGTTAGSVYNPMLGAQESPMGGLFLRIISYIFFATGGFTAFLGILFASYQAYPIGELGPSFVHGWQHVVFPFVSNVFQLGILYAMPLLIVFFFLDFGLGLMNRFVPSLNVFFISLPIKSGLCFFFLLFYMNYIIKAFEYDIVTPGAVAAFLKKIFH